MESTSRSCLKQLAFGCGGLILLGLGTFGVLIFLTVNPLGSAIETREQLDRLYGDQSSYTPPPDGAVAPDRLVAFLAVRHEVSALCDGFRAAEGQIQGMERFDDAAEVDRSEVMLEALKTTRTALGIAPQIGELFETRNQALLEAGMGLGEYSYIYTVAYHDRLTEHRPPGALFDEPVTNVRIREALRSILTRQLEALRAAQGSPEAIAALAAEVATMTEDADRLPWQDGLQAPVAASVEPERERLDAAYCDVIASLDLRRNVTRSLSIDTE